jgi:ABC-type branched-subunit amino acid transport system substrate-binding protein
MIAAHKNKNESATQSYQPVKKEVAMKKKKLFLICIILVFLVVMLSKMTFSTARAADVKTLKIGYVLCVSGWYSVFDAVEEGHLKIVAQMINDKGGLTIKGQKYKIELVGEDGKSSLDGITAAATRLAYDHQVKFVVGPTGFFSTGSSPVFEQNKILHVSGYVSNQPGELDASTPYGFLAFDASIGTTIGALKVMKKEFPNVKKVAVVSPDDGAIPYLIPLVENLLQKNGYIMAGDVVAFPNEMEDFSPIAAKLNAIKDADAVFVENGSPIAVGNIAKGLRALGNNKPIVYQGLSSCKDIRAIAGKEASNDITTMGLTPLAEGNPPLMDEVYRRSGEKEPIFLFNPNGLWVLAHVIQAADSLDPAVVKAKWETMDTIESLFGTAIFSGDKTYGLKHHALGHPLPYQKLVKGEVVYGGWIDVGPIP